MVQNKREKTDRPKDVNGGRLISVVMPAFNAERTIAGSINSILTQTYENWELIIVNDGSEDKTEEVLKRFQDPRIKYFKRPRLGIPATRNFGSSKARGDIIVVQDSDDYSFPQRLEKIARHDNDFDILIHDAYVNSWNAQYGCMERYYLETKVGKEAALNNQIPGWPAYKKSIWEAKPFREETKYAYDWMMHLDWTLSGFKYVTLHEPLYEYVRYQGSASDTFEKTGLRKEAFIKVKEIVKNEYGETTCYGNDGQLQ